MNFIVSAGLLAIGAFLIYQLIRLLSGIIRAKRKIDAVKRSDDHQSKIRMFVEAQTKMMKLDLLLGAQIIVVLVIVAVLLAKYIERMG